MPSNELSVYRATTPQELAELYVDMFDTGELGYRYSREEVFVTLPALPGSELTLHVSQYRPTRSRYSAHCIEIDKLCKSGARVLIGTLQDTERLADGTIKRTDHRWNHAVACFLVENTMTHDINLFTTVPGLFDGAKVRHAG